VTPDDAKVLWAKVQANSKALEACAKPHVFVSITPERKLGGRWRCTLCGGEVEQLHRYWYERGLAHGRAAALRKVREAFVKAYQGGALSQSDLLDAIDSVKP